MTVVPNIKSKKALKDDSRKSLRIAFCHPDLGLGGAERLVVDAAAELTKRGHEVHMYTAFYDPNRAFEETRLFPVHVRGNWFPRAILGRFIAVCAYIRCILVALSIAFDSTLRGKDYDVILIDQVSVVMPILFLLTRAKTVFYCHFPDLLLSNRKSFIKRLYRLPLDFIEERTTGWADRVLVNSEYTRGVFAATFKSLHARGIEPEVVYPAVPVPPKKSPATSKSADPASSSLKKWEELRGHLTPETCAFVEGGPTFLSINRFERKKNLALAVQALHELRVRNAHTPARLVMAGGYDRRLRENVEYFDELKGMAREMGLEDKVHFLPSFADKEREALLAACVAVVYTPENEHFGIVPLEAMAAGRPVIACASGGPLESIVHGKTGLLSDPTPAAFCDAMVTLLESGASARMGANAVEHVRSSFSREYFGQRLETILRETVFKRGPGSREGSEGAAGKAK